MNDRNDETSRPNRREMLHRAAAGFGSLALAALLADETRAAAPTNPHAPRKPHIEARAKPEIFLVGPGAAHRRRSPVRSGVPPRRPPGDLRIGPEEPDQQPEERPGDAGPATPGTRHPAPAERPARREPNRGQSSVCPNRILRVGLPD